MTSIPSAKRSSFVSAKETSDLFGGLVSSASVWFDADSGILSVNTQARRLGCLIFLIGAIAHGRKLESLLFSLPASEISQLKDNLSNNGFLSGQLTSKASSVKHYIEAAVQLHLLARQGSMLSLTSKGQLLMTAIRPNSKLPYPLTSETKVFFLNTLLTTDYFGLAAVITSLLRGVRRLAQLQRDYQSQLLHVLQSATRSSADSRLHRMAQDRTLAIRNWKKPQSYAEHLVSAKINWLTDLGILKSAPGSSAELVIAPEHEKWLTVMCETTAPSDADLVAFNLNYAVNLHTSENDRNDSNECQLLDFVFSRVPQHGSLMKVRSADVVLLLVCFRSSALHQAVLGAKPLFQRAEIECPERSYKVNIAARSTQSFIVRTNNGGS